MLCYYRIHIREGIALGKSKNSRECMICHNFFFNHGFEFQECVCYGCCDLLISSVNIRAIAIITIENVDYCCIIHNISKSEAINLLKNSVLENCGYRQRKYCLKFQSFSRHFFFFTFFV